MLCLRLFALLSLTDWRIGNTAVVFCCSLAVDCISMISLMSACD